MELTSRNSSKNGVANYGFENGNNVTKSDQDETDIYGRTIPPTIIQPTPEEITFGYKPTSIRQILRKACTTSTVRGVRRVYTSDTLPWRLIWLVTVVSFFIASLVLSIQAIELYFKYQIISSEELYPLYDAKLPGLTVCQWRQLAINETLELQDYLSRTRNISLSQFTKTLMKYGDLWVVNQEVIGQILIWSYLRSINYKFVSNFPDDFMIKCSIYRDTNSGSSYYNCSGVEVKDYFNCRTIIPPNSNPAVQSFSKSFDFAIYLNVENNYAIEKYRTLFESKGLRYIMHDQSFTPTLGQLAFSSDFVAPGYEVVLDVQVTAYEKLSKPHGTCNQTLTQESWYHCIRKCIIEKIIQICNCINVDMPSFPDKFFEPYKRNYNECFSLELPDILLARQIECVLNIESGGKQLCKSECGTLCHSVDYTSTRVVTQWPPFESVIDVYEKNVKGTSFADKFYVYQEIINLRETNPKAAEMKRMLTSLINENFIRYYFTQHQINVRHIVDMPIYTVNSVLAVIGGTMSLWLGVTLITIIEFFEFIADLVMLGYRKCKLKLYGKDSGVAS